MSYTTYKNNGTITMIEEPRKGTSRAGVEYSMTDLLIEVEGFDGRAEQMKLTAGTFLSRQVEGLKVGDKVAFEFFVRAREYNGRWYNDVNLERIDVTERPHAESKTAEEQEDLPF